jgi:predicted  nucleic acid-binding Zn-ribbon protein
MTTRVGLAELAALVEVTKDPARYEAMLTELTVRATSLDTREKRLNEQKAALDKRAQALNDRELDMLKRLEGAADQRAQEKLRYAQRQADERLAEVNAIMATVNGLLARLAKVADLSSDAKKAAEKALKVA